MESLNKTFVFFTKITSVIYKKYVSKMTKNDNRADLPPGYQKTTKNQKYQYSSYRVQIHLPKNRKWTPQDPPQDPPQSSQDPSCQVRTSLDPSRDPPNPPGTPPRTLPEPPGPSQDPAKTSRRPPREPTAPQGVPQDTTKTLQEPRKDPSGFPVERSRTFQNGIIR